MADKIYNNITEGIVEDVYEEIKGRLGICDCEQCRGDVIAYALNQLPPRYVVSKIGEAAMKVQALSFQNHADVQSALYKGADLILQHPRHEVK